MPKRSLVVRVSLIVLVVAGSTLGVALAAGYIGPISPPLQEAQHAGEITLPESAGAERNPASSGGHDTAALSASARIPSNSLSLRANTQVHYDPDAGLYTYQYSFTNESASQLEADLIIVPLNDSSVLNVVAPAGWHGAASSDGSRVGWYATAPATIPPGGDPDGRYPSAANIKPGQTVSGFSFQSPDPPDFVDFLAQGFTDLPAVGVDTPEDDDEVPTPPPVADEYAIGRCKGPRYSDQLFTGGRRPAVDGFLAFRNLAAGDNRPAPLQVDIEFAISGEAVNQSSFRATLNNTDVTARFQVTGPNTRRAVFQLGSSSPLLLGRNVLLTTVDGTVPGTNRTAKDVDRVAFTVVP